MEMGFAHGMLDVSLPYARSAGEQFVLLGFPLRLPPGCPGRSAGLRRWPGRYRRRREPAAFGGGRRGCDTLLSI